MQCQKNYLSLEQPAQEAESFSMVEKNTWETTDCLKFWIKLLQIENLMCIITNICKMLIMSKRAISCNHHRWCHTVLYHALPSLGEYTAILLILKVLM